MRGARSCVLAIALALQPLQAAPPAWLVPSPLSIVLTVGTWMQKDRVEVYYVQVQAHGRDEADAREQAFRLAVNQAVGSLLLSHAEVRNGEVMRRDIINYSSGHIHDFNILKRENRDGGILLQADVWVRKSQIADRLLNESRAAGRVEGGRISEQINSFQHQKTQADRVIQTVLDDFPQRAFDVSVGRTQVAVHDRKTYLQVPIAVGWNSRYLASMSEALRTVNPRPDCQSWLAVCDNNLFVARVGRAKVAHFEDSTAVFELFDRGISQKAPVALLQLKDGRGQTVFEACYRVSPMDNGNYHNWHFAAVDGWGVHFREGVSQEILTIETNLLPLNHIDRAEVTIVPIKQCPGYSGRR